MKSFLEYCKMQKIKEGTRRFEWARYVYMDVIREVRGELIHNTSAKDVDDLLGKKLESAFMKPSFPSDREDVSME